MQCFFQLVSLLLRYGADAGRFNSLQKTPLDVATDDEIRKVISDDQLTRSREGRVVADTTNLMTAMVKVSSAQLPKATPSLDVGCPLTPTRLFAADCEMKNSSCNSQEVKLINGKFGSK